MVLTYGLFAAARLGGDEFPFEPEVRENAR
jgi:hypothetical protein